MLILYNYHIIFLHVPKTAGVAIRNHLKNFGGPTCELWGIHPIYGDLAHISQSKLTNLVIVDNLKDYTTLCVVRNPYDRLVSVFNYLNTKPTFREFVDDLVSTPQETWKVHARPQVTFVEDVSKTTVLHFETLKNDFAQLCRSLKLPRHLSEEDMSEPRDYMSYYDAHTLEVVNRLYKNDFETFGYNLTTTI